MSTPYPERSVELGWFLDYHAVKGSKREPIDQADGQCLAPDTPKFRSRQS
ncbi:hypothetical protein [Singulisphaera sp. PoT]